MFKTLKRRIRFENGQWYYKNEEFNDLGEGSDDSRLKAETDCTREERIVANLRRLGKKH